MDSHVHPTFARAARLMLGVACMAAGFAVTARALALDNIVMVAGAEEVDELTARFRASLRAALESGDAARARWPKVEWQGLACYEPLHVSRTLESLKGDIQMAASSDARLAALNVYLEARLEEIGRMPPTLIITEHGAEPKGVRRLLGVRADQADTSWQELKAFARHLLTEPLALQELTVSSQPAGAKIELRVVSATVKQITAYTDVQFNNLWRGQYHLVAEKPGYKPVALDLQVPARRNTTVSCLLAKARSSEASRCVVASTK